MEEFRPKQKTVMLILTENCNLACVYCYEHNKSKRRMSFEVAKKIIDKELTKDDGYEEVIIEFFGGEPFLEFDVMRRTHDYIFSKKWPKKVLCFTTTNGTLVHKEIKEWLKKNSKTFWVALSLDGTKKMHDLNRCNSYDLIDVDFFKDTWPLQTCKMTISKETLPMLAEGIIYLQDKGFPLTATMAQGINWDKENLKTLKQQIQILTDYYLKNPDKPVCDFLDVKLGLVNFSRDVKEVKWCGVGKEMICYDVSGNYYPCQAFAPQTLGEDAINFKNTNLEKFKDGFLDEDCAKCPAYPVCRTCYGANYLLFKDYKRRDKTMCEFNKLCILASGYIKYHRYIKKDPNSLTNDEILELAAIKKLQNLELKDVEIYN